MVIVGHVGPHRHTPPTAAAAAAVAGVLRLTGMVVRAVESGHTLALTRILSQQKSATMTMNTRGRTMGKLKKVIRCQTM